MYLSILYDSIALLLLAVMGVIAVVINYDKVYKP